MATRSTILAGRIPRTEGPGGLQFIGSKSVGHDYIQRKWWFWSRLFREPAIPLFVPWKACSVQEIQLPWQTTDLWGIPNSWEESGHADGSQGARHVSEMISPHHDLTAWRHGRELMHSPAKSCLNSQPTESGEITGHCFEPLSFLRGNRKRASWTCSGLTS